MQGTHIDPPESTRLDDPFLTIRSHLVAGGERLGSRTPSVTSTLARTLGGECRETRRSRGLTSSPAGLRWDEAHPSRWSHPRGRVDKWAGRDRRCAASLQRGFTARFTARLARFTARLRARVLQLLLQLLLQLRLQLGLQLGFTARLTEPFTAPFIARSVALLVSRRTELNQTCVEATLAGARVRILAHSTRSALLDHRMTPPWEPRHDSEFHASTRVRRCRELPTTLRSPLHARARSLCQLCVRVVGPLS